MSKRFVAPSSNSGQPSTSQYISRSVCESTYRWLTEREGYDRLPPLEPESLYYPEITQEIKGLKCHELIKAGAQLVHEAGAGMLIRFQSCI
jgi:hypothetical protein